MKFTLGVTSIILFGLSILFLVLITLFESALSGLRNTTERLLSLLLLVVPGIVGVVFGVLGVARKETGIWVAYLGILLNAVWALFQLFIISFAG